MYIPEYFRVRNHEDAIKFMRANPFGILISSTEAGPFATHLPLFVRAEKGGEKEEEKIVLRGHVAKANPHWRYLEQQPQCLTIFHGPHSYISPTNYTEHESVPTWNYGAVHLYGNAKLFSSPEALQGVLHELIQTFEPAYGSQWASLDEGFRQRMLRQIVGFEVEVTKMEAKFKLGQNRSREDQANMLASLEKSDDTAVSGVARLMKEQRVGRVQAGEEDK